MFPFFIIFNEFFFTIIRDWLFFFAGVMLILQGFLNSCIQYFLFVSSAWASRYIMFEVMEGAYDISCPDRDCLQLGFLYSCFKYFCF